MRLTFHGAAGEVTGSCLLVETASCRVLIDCGMFQGSSGANEKNLAPFPFEPSTIDALITTHAHTDHIGRAPRLVKQGFKGRIFATHPTRLLSKYMWQDAAHVLKDEARRYGKEPLYIPADIAAVYDATHGVDYDTKVKVGSGFSFTFREAGHIFGSAFVEIEADGIRMVCSGDLGNDNTPILRPTAARGDADIVVIESTYGNRVHEDASTRQEKLRQAVVDAVARKGTLLIPAFSLERTQELLYELNDLELRGQLPKTPTFLDSPLAIKVLPIYHEFPELYNPQAAALEKSGDDFFQFPGLHVMKTPEQSHTIAGFDPPKIIIAGSGMMHGGRIMHHLVDYLNDPRNSVLIVGYQSPGTVGREVLDGAKQVKIEHDVVTVRAHVEFIGAYSAHADKLKLIRWLGGAKTEPKTVYVNHGEPEASAALATEAGTKLGLNAIVAERGAVYEH